MGSFDSTYLRKYKNRPVKIAVFDCLQLYVCLIYEYKLSKNISMFNNQSSKGDGLNFEKNHMFVKAYDKPS